jgi:hypothetical protein
VKVLDGLERPTVQSHSSSSAGADTRRSPAREARDLRNATAPTHRAGRHRPDAAMATGMAPVAALSCACQGGPLTSRRCRNFWHFSRETRTWSSLQNRSLRAWATPIEASLRPNRGEAASDYFRKTTRTRSRRVVPSRA